VASIALARTGLVTFGATVAKIGGGTLTSYDIKSFHDAASPTIPCLIAALDLESDLEWEATAMMGGAVQERFVLEHFLLVKKVEGEADFTYIEPDIVTYIDNYFAALAATPFFTASTAPSIHYSPMGRGRIQRSQWKEVQYHTIIFRLECGINV
jgi:hypothetical protein